MTLIDRTDNANSVIAGRFNLPSIVAMLGEGSFDHPFDAPWETLLNSRPNCDLAIGLQTAWSHLTINFQEVATPAQLADTTTYLLTQHTSRAGFYEDGSFAPSVTKAITNELEKARSIVLGSQISTSLDRDDYERLSWEAWSKISLASSKTQYSK
jgi:hypothetical protein